MARQEQTDTGDIAVPSLPAMLSVYPKTKRYQMHGRAPVRVSDRPVIHQDVLFGELAI